MGDTAIQKSIKVVLFHLATCNYKLMDTVILSAWGLSSYFST